MHTVGTLTQQLRDDLPNLKTEARGDHIAPGLSREFSERSLKNVGTAAWDRMVARRDPVAASHARTEDAFKLRGTDIQRKRENSLKNIKGVRKPVTRRCRVCDSLIYGRKGSKTCSPLCQRIHNYEAMTSGTGARWKELHDRGESWSAIGRQYGVSHNAVRSAVLTHERYLRDLRCFEEFGPGEVPEKRI